MIVYFYYRSSIMTEVLASVIQYKNNTYIKRVSFDGYQTIRKLYNCINELKKFGNLEYEKGNEFKMSFSNHEKKTVKDVINKYIN